MKKVLFLASFMLLSILVSAQVTDFSGSWKLNPGKSKLNAEFSMAPKEVIITQSGNNLESERHMTFNDQTFVTKDKYTLDGKECINKGWRDTEKKSVVKVSDDKKSIIITTTVPMRDNGSMTLTETYKLDGGSLVIESKGSSPMGERSETMVYDK